MRGDGNTLVGGQAVAGIVDPDLVERGGQGIRSRLGQPLPVLGEPMCSVAVLAVVPPFGRREVFNRWRVRRGGAIFITGRQAGLGQTGPTRH